MRRKIIELLKKEARNHGADAIIHIQIQKDTELVPKSIDFDPDAEIIDIESTKRIEAKAIVFE